MIDFHVRHVQYGCLKGILDSRSQLLVEKQGEFDKSIGEYQEALKYTPDTANILGDIGRVLYRNHDVNGSLMYLEQCLVKHPGDREAKKLLKLVRNEIGI